MLWSLIGLIFFGIGLTAPIMTLARGRSLDPFTLGFTLMAALAALVMVALWTERQEITCDEAHVRSRGGNVFYSTSREVARGDIRRPEIQVRKGLRMQGGGRIDTHHVYARLHDGARVRLASLQNQRAAQLLLEALIVHGRLPHPHGS